MKLFTNFNPYDNNSFIFFSERKNIKTSLETKNKCLDNNEHKCFETVRKKFGKNIIATFQVGVHHNKCCKLINSMYIFNLLFNITIIILLDI